MGKENADSHLKILVQCYVERGMEFVWFWRGDSMTKMYRD